MTQELPLNLTFPLCSGLVTQELPLNLTSPHLFRPGDPRGAPEPNTPLCSGLVTHEVPLNLTRYLVKETELVPWEVALKHLRSWEDIFR